MKTRRLQASDPAAVEQAAELLRKGGLVAFPTETVYGLGAHACSTEAVRGIFRAKERPSWDPLIVHLAQVKELQTVVRVPMDETKRVEALAAAFWPGPLTMLLPRAPQIPDEVTAGRPLVGIRVPAHRVAQSLLQAAGVPVAAPSANRFGHVSPTTAEHVLADLDGRIDAVLDGGPCAVGVESTVLDPATTPIVVYRAGAVTTADVLRASGVPAELFAGHLRAEGDRAALPSPGVGLRHYAPRIPLVLCLGDPKSMAAAVTSLADRGRVGVLLPEPWGEPAGDGIVVRRWGHWDQPERLAAELFASLRALEEQDVDVLLCPTPREGGLGDALRDRLMKAARTA